MVKEEPFSEDQISIDRSGSILESEDGDNSDLNPVSSGLRKKKTLKLGQASEQSDEDVDDSDSKLLSLDNQSSSQRQKAKDKEESTAAALARVKQSFTSMRETSQMLFPDENFDESDY